MPPAFLGRLLANDIGKLREPGRGLYSCMLNDAGGVVDDLIAYWTGDDRYRLVVNAATRAQDLAWLARIADRDDVVLRHRDDLLMLAVQGPKACQLAAPLLPGGLGAAALALRPFGSVLQDDLFVARTGYTGEDGFEIVLPVPAGLALMEGAGRGRRHALRPRRPRYPAAGGGAQPLRAGHGCGHVATRLGPGLDGGLRAARTGSSAGGRRWSSRRRRA